MIGWQFPSAFWALALLAGPIAVHLLRRHRADRVLFPNLRFVRASQTAAVRLRPPTDWWLLLIRALVVGLVVAALAGPVVLTEARMTRWNVAIARAVVVDSTESMRSARDGATSSASSSAIVEAELRDATYARRMDVADVEDGLRRGARWLASTPPSRKEIVLVSDFQRGSVDLEALKPVLDELQDTIGFRPVLVETSPSTWSGNAHALIGAPEIPARSRQMVLTPEDTRVTVHREAQSWSGIRFLTPGSAAPTTGAGDPNVARLLRTIAAVGTPDGASDEPIMIRFAGAAMPKGAPVSPIRGGWMLRTVAGLHDDPDVKSLVATIPPMKATAQVLLDAPWSVVVRREDGWPIVSAASSSNELVLDTAIGVDTLAAAAVVRAVLNARAGIETYAEREIGHEPATAIEALSRPPGPVDRDGWRNADVTDGRWFWAVALVLLALEQWLRRGRRATTEVDRAAA